MKIHRIGSADWQGGIRDGKGSISTESGAMNHYPYGFASRFEGQPGTNPEELIGAAHAGCFTMALSLALTQAKLAVEKLETSAKVTLEQVDERITHAVVKRVLPEFDDGDTWATFLPLRSANVLYGLSALTIVHS